MKKDFTIKNYVERIAEHRGWEPNPDKEFTQHIEKGLETNKERHGFFLCPCRESWGDPVKDKDIRCPCAYAEKDIQEYGQCYCGLFLSKDKAQHPEEITAIPDRRPEELYPED